MNGWIFQKDGVVTDFVSFYTLPSTVMHHPTYKTLKAAYSFYNVAKSSSWVDLMTDALIVAKKVSLLSAVKKIELRGRKAKKKSKIMC